MQGISEIITVPGRINVDFADVQTIMADAGSALLGIGIASGENRAVEAARAARQQRQLAARRGAPLLRMPRERIM